MIKNNSMIMYHSFSMIMYHSFSMIKNNLKKLITS